MTFSLEIKNLCCHVTQHKYKVWGVVIGTKEDDEIKVDGIHLDHVIMDNTGNLAQMYALNQIQMQHFAERLHTYPIFFKIIHIISTIFID